MVLKWAANFIKPDLGEELKMTSLDGTVNYLGGF
jgi:hypothetical protein